MSYSANKYNYATPLSSVTSLTEATPAVNDRKYFTLSNNVLDGSYVPITGDVGLWGAALSNSDGVLSEPLVVTVTENLTINAFRLVGSQYSYPVAFTVVFKNGVDTLYTITETNNDSAEYINYLPETLLVTEYVITVSKVSSANSVARLYNAYNPAYVKRKDALTIVANDTGVVSHSFTLKREDTLRVAVLSATPHIMNTIDTTQDTLKVSGVDSSELTNIHSVMKQPFRQIYGKVYITYTDPMLDDATTVKASDEAYNSNIEQVLDTTTDTDGFKYFNLYDNNLSGEYRVTDANSQVGWVSAVVSDENGFFSEPPSLSTEFFARPITSLSVAFDKNNVIRDFSVVLTRFDSSEVTYDFTDNTEAILNVVRSSVADVVEVTLIAHRVSKPNSPAIVLDMPISSTVLYKGYKEESDIMSIDLLEELTYEDEIEALGGVSANEVTIVLDNSKKQFFFNSGSVVAKQLKRNRKIVPWLGAEITPGQIEWYTLGTFWSYKWDVPTNGLTASVVAFDTIGLLGNTNFTNHHVQVNGSIGYLIEYVLEDAKMALDFIEYDIDPSLYDIVIPYAWFEAGSHAAALRKISMCYPMHIYCDRAGRICARPQKLHLDYYYDTWKDSTNVIEKNYSSLYTTLPNIISVKVTMPTILDAQELAKDTAPFTVNGYAIKTLNFSNPYLSNFDLTVDCDSTVIYDYSVYDWGAEITFVGIGTVRSIQCLGSCLDTSNSTVIVSRDETSIRLNGAVTRDVQSDFIQTEALANLIINRLVSLSENDKYDATVSYRGDISLTINDPILLEDGIAPDNRYNIKRHQLSWNGGLTGSADLNT